MNDLSQYSDAELEALAGGQPSNPPAANSAPVPVPGFISGPLDHMSDEELEKLAGPQLAPAQPKPSAPQYNGFWREPAIAASNFVQKAVTAIPGILDTIGHNPTPAEVLAEETLDDLGSGKSRTTQEKLDQGYKAVAQDKTSLVQPVDQLMTDAGIANRPDLQPQGTGEKYLAAASGGAGAMLPFAATGGGSFGMNLLRGATGGMGAQAGSDMFPNSKAAPIIGSLIGGVAPDATGALWNGGKSLVQNAFGLYDPSERADEILARKLMQDKIQPSNISDQMAQFPDKPLTIADLGGPNTQRLVRTTLDVPSDASSAGTKFLQDRDLGTPINGEFDMMRQGGTADRVAMDIKNALGSDDALKSIDQLVQEGDTKAAPLYDAFRAQPPTPARQIQPFMSSPTFRKALGQANNELLDEGKPPLTDVVDFNEAGDPIKVTGGAFSPDSLDRIKQGIDTVWLSAKGSGDRGAFRTANLLRNRFVDFMDAKYPDTYAQARQAFAGPASAREAIQNGMEVFQNNPEDVASTLQNLSPENRDWFRIGVQKALIGKVMNTADGANEVRNIFGNPAKRASVAAAFNDPQALNDLSQSLGVENRMFQTKNVAGGSRTTPSLLDQNDLAEQFGKAKDLGEGAVSLMDGNLFTAGRKLLGPLVQRFGNGANEETSSLLAQRLLDPNYTQNQARLQLVQALMNKQQPPSMMSTLPFFGAQ